MFNSNVGKYGDFLFSTRPYIYNSISATERKRIASGGNVAIGVGINNTTYRLNVDDNINSTSLYQNGTLLNLSTYDATTSQLAIKQDTNCFNNIIRYWFKHNINLLCYSPANMSYIYTKGETDTFLNTKQATLTASTILSGIGSNITLINYATLSNIPSTFPANMTNIYTNGETDTLLNTKQATLTAATTLLGTLLGTYSY